MKNFNYYGFLTLFGILFLIVLNKVLYVPMTHDELATVRFYYRFSFWEIMMYRPDTIPNNHILNTLLTKCCIQFFGKEQWAVRLPNLLSFPLYSVGVYRFLKQSVKPDSFFFLPAAILFINPYLLDFFGVCRGYGMSSALAMLSVSFLVSGFVFKKPWHIWGSLLISILASYANFTLLIFWAATSIMVWFYFLIRANRNLKRLLIPTILIILISSAYMALIMIPLERMHSTDEFHYWTSKGFYKDTVESLLFYWRYDSKVLLKISTWLWFSLIVSVILLNFQYLLRKGLKEKDFTNTFSHPASLSITLLLLTILINIAQTKIMGTPNLNGRTALFFYPLVSTIFATSLSLISQQWNKISIKITAFALGTISLVNLTNRVTLKSVKEWSYDQNTFEVIDFLKDKYQGEPISLETSWFFNPSFYFYCETGKAPWINLKPYKIDIDITTSAEYYYIFAENYKQLETKFDIVYKFSPDRWLLRKKIWLLTGKNH